MSNVTISREEVKAAKKAMASLVRLEVMLQEVPDCTDEFLARLLEQQYVLNKLLLRLIEEKEFDNAPSE